MAGKKRKDPAGSAERTVLRDITSVTPYLKPFPATEDVFGEPLQLHRKHFLPLVSVNPAVVQPDLDLWLHFVIPVEPLLELDVGYFTQEYHDYYNQMGQVAFRLEEGRYSFTGDFNYFAYESGAIFKAFPGRDNEIHEDYHRRRTTHAAAAQRFQQTGRLYQPYFDRDDSAEIDRKAKGRSGLSFAESYSPFVVQLGGSTDGGNFGSELPGTKSKRPFRFIGELYGFSYCEGAATWVFLYYEPEEKIALIRLDYD
jgi:hypothetical protein